MSSTKQWRQLLHPSGARDPAHLTWTMSLGSLWSCLWGRLLHLPPSVGLQVELVHHKEHPPRGVELDAANLQRIWGPAEVRCPRCPRGQPQCPASLLEELRLGPWHLLIQAQESSTPLRLSQIPALSSLAPCSLVPQVYHPPGLRRWKGGLFLH